MAAKPQTLALEDHARLVVKMLLAREGRREKHLAEMLGCTRQTANNKLRGVTRFSIDELTRLAALFVVDVRVFFDPDRRIPTLPVMPPALQPVRAAAPDLLTCTNHQVVLVRGHFGAAAVASPHESPLSVSARAA